MGSRYIRCKAGAVYAAITNMDGVEKLWADLHTTGCGSGLVEHPDNVYLVQYLIAFKRQRTNCDCGVEASMCCVSRRTLNHERTLYLLREKAQDMQNDAFCDCALSVTVRFRNDKNTKYICSKLRASCRFN